MSNQEFIPVYLITGFLESGKTTLISGMLADEDFTRRSAGGKQRYRARINQRIEHQRDQLKIYDTADQHPHLPLLRGIVLLAGGMPGDKCDINGPDRRRRKGERSARNADGGRERGRTAQNVQPAAKAHQETDFGAVVQDDADQQ